MSLVGDVAEVSLCHFAFGNGGGNQIATVAISPGSGLVNLYFSGVAPRFLEWYTHAVPTLKSRIQITESETITAALALAEEVWPNQPKSVLLTKLVELGAGELPKRNLSKRTQQLKRRIEALGDQFSDCYPENYLAELRKDWDN